MPTPPAPPKGRKPSSALNGSFLRIAGINANEARDGQVWVQMVDHRDLFMEQRRQAARRDYRHGLAVFRLDARHQSFDQPDITPIQAGLDRRYGVLANHRLGAFDGVAG